MIWIILFSVVIGAYVSARMLEIDGHSDGLDIIGAILLTVPLTSISFLLSLLFVVSIKGLLVMSCG